VCTHPEAPATAAAAWALWLLLLALALIKAWQRRAAGGAGAAAAGLPSRLATPAGLRLSSNGISMQPGRVTSSAGITSISSWWGRVAARAPLPPARSSAFPELAAPLLDSDEEGIEEEGGEGPHSVAGQQQGWQQGPQPRHLGAGLLAADPLPFSLRACWLLLQTLLDCLLVFAWGLAPSSRYWPSLALLSCMALPHLLVALAIHVELIRSEGEGGGVAARWYYGGMLRAQRPWACYALLLATLVPVLLLLAAAGPVLLAAALCGRAHLLPARHHVRLLHTLVSLCEAPFQAALVSMMYLLGNNASYQVGRGGAGQGGAGQGGAGWAAQACAAPDQTSVPRRHRSCLPSGQPQRPGPPPCPRAPWILLPQAYMDQQLFLVALAVAQGTMLMCWYALLAGWRAGREGSGAGAGGQAAATGAV
jgi:hypothetical protein